MNAITSPVSERAAAHPAAGRVVLVGAGPGTVDLITCRGAQMMAEADVIIADGLVGEDFRALAGPQTRWIDAAKRVGNPSITQDGIVKILIAEALAGNLVVRLKGGDVCLFARAGEEIAALQAAGIPVDVVPGVTAASAAASSIGISLTHRDLASAVTFITGQTKNNDLPDLDGIAGGQQTLVIYMGLGSAQSLSDALVVRGYLPSAAVAVVEQASQDGERILFGTLRTLANLISDQTVQSPALIIVGDVVRTGQGWWRSENDTQSLTAPAQARFAHG